VGTDFKSLSGELADALCGAMGSYVARLEGALVKEGVDEQELLEGLELELCTGIRKLLSLAPQEQRSPPIGLIRQIVVGRLAGKVPPGTLERLSKRGLIPTAAIDIDPELGEVHMRWGLAKAQAVLAPG
jgi:hypothetical protein